MLDEGRRPSLRANLGDAEVSWDDIVLGPMAGTSDDPIVRRADGVFAYNLAVVVDDSAAGIDQVVRGDDLAHAVPTQAALCDALAIERPEWGHVPLVLGAGGERLAKRDGAVTLEDRVNAGEDASEVLSLLAMSLGLGEAGERVDATALLARFDPARIPSGPWILPGA